MSNQISSKSIYEGNSISMSGKYREYCMKFSNEELKENMIEYLINNSWSSELIRCLSEDGDELDINTSEKIGTIVLDGGGENLFINFNDISTSIFVQDVELMFIDEDSKGIYTLSDVYNNVVYEGNLREMSHEEMLRMFSEIILCFIDATSIHITQLDVPETSGYQRYNYYEPHLFIINVENNHADRQSRTFENITINY